MAIELVGVPPPSALAPPSIFICLFSYGGIDPNTLRTMQDELNLLHKGGVRHTFFNIHGDALVSRSRSKALSEFLATDLDVCFMADHDIQWTPGALFLTAQKAAQRGAMVGGLYPCRGMNRGLSSRMRSTEVAFKAGEDKLLDAEYLATGFLAIPRVVAQETLEHGLRVDQLAQHRLHHCLYSDGTGFYDFFRPLCVRRTVQVVSAKVLPPYEYLSEDWAFSCRARAANPDRPIYAWTAPWLVHHGSYGYTLLDAYRERP